MDMLAIQSAFILGGTSFVGKFLKEPNERDLFLPIIALLLGVLSQCYLYGWSPDMGIAGAVLGGSVTGLYATVKSKSETAVAVHDGNTN